MSYNTSSANAVLSSTPEEYSFAFPLEGHQKPVNSLAFNDQGTMLASGGDDEEVFIWDLKTQKCIQTINDGHRWGQITTIKFIDLDLNGTGSHWLFFGTGRGRLSICRWDRKAAQFAEICLCKIFGPGDGLESFDVDPYGRRVAVASLHGVLKMYRFNGSVLSQLWAEGDLQTIPRALLFTDRGATLVTYGMETGTICNRDVETSQVTSVKRLRTPIGDFDFNATTNHIAVDNMRNGFDIYPLHRTTPIRSLCVESTRCFIKAVCFAERGKQIVCGSDHGRGYIFSTSKPGEPQVLKHGDRAQMIQAAAAVSSQGTHYIATAASSGGYSIKIWTKQAARPKHQPKPSDVFDLKLFINVVLLIVVALLSKDSWLPQAQMHCAHIKAEVTTRWAHTLESMMPTPAPAHHISPTIDLGKLIHELDDASARKLFGMGPRLTEQELLAFVKDSQ